MNESTNYPRFRWLVLLAASLAIITSSIDLIAYAPLLGEIARDLGVDMGAATNLMTVGIFSWAIMLIVGGFLCDSLGVMLVIILSILFASIPAVLMPWIGTTYKVVFWTRIIQGIALGFSASIMSPILSVWFPPKERGIAGGVLGTSFGVGALIGVVAAPAVFLALRNWQQMSAWLSIPGWVALVVALVTVLSPKPQGLPSQSQPSKAAVTDRSAFKRALAAPVTWIGVIATFFSAWCLQTIWNLLPAYFAADKPIGVGFGPMMSGQLMMAVLITGIVVPIIGGILVDKVFRGNSKPLLVIGFVLSCLFVYPIQFASIYANLLLLVLCLTLAGAGVSVLYPAVTVFVSMAYPVQIAGRMIGLYLGIGAFGGAAGLFAGGLAVAKFGNYKLSITQIALAALVGFIFTLFMKRPQHPESISRN